ncbi:hypothetical protein D9K79_16300 [Acinetobacter cumulans]|uniref:ATP-binding protein n=1 Tax=Acinetobacter cumulans TaxID=2136182 RepID=A0ABX9U1Y0_9GAMM|nr:hypothetical protein [Acinetobacter cumulans]RLL38323.1 hypothetical protein D9K79_16300 [Acinetobacter cumulans]
MINDSLSLLQFTLKRLVFVNAAKHAYSELLLDQHLAMFGRNNNGKTASLAATKLLLFPEVNFKHCFQKFGFEGKDGQYDTEQSFRFYFPTLKSYIALEVENPSGTFTMVLFRAPSSEKSQNYAYHRAFIPLPYQEVRHLFWNEFEQDFAENLSTESLLKFTQKQRGLIIQEAAKLRQMIFARLGSPDAQYCIIPLKNNNADSINAFRKVYNLAFSMSSNVSDVLSSAIAALIEMQRGRKEEKLDHDLEETYQKYLQLNQQSQTLKLKQNNLERFNLLASEFKAIYQATYDYSTQHQAIDYYVNLQRNKLKPEKIKQQSQLNEFNLQLRDLKNNIAQIKETVIGLETNLRTRNKDVNLTNKDIENAQKVQYEYPHDMSIHEIKAALYAETQELMKERELLRDSTKVAEEFQKKRKLLNERQQQLEQLSTEIQSIKNQKDDELLVNQVTDHSRQILHSLNSKLVNIRQALPAEDLHTVESFTALFQMTSSSLSFKNQLIAIPSKQYQPKQVLQQLEDEFLALNVDVENLAQDVKYLEQLIRNAHNLEFNQANELKLSNDIQKNENDMRLLDALASNTQRAKEFTTEINSLNEQKEKYVEQLNAYEIQFDDLRNLQGNCQSILDQLTDQHDKFKKIVDFLGHASQMYAVLPSTAADHHESQLNSTAVHDLFEQAHGLSDLAKQLKDKYNQFVFKFTQFSNEVPTADIDLNRVYIQLDELEQSFEIYQNMFANLDLEHQQFKHAVLGHNEEIRSQVNEINEAQDQLHRVVAMINQKINHHQISNLTEIRLQLDTVSDFDALKNTLEKHNISGETLAEESFYLSLIAFFNKHQDKGRLKMANLIESIQYRYKIDGQEVVKSQSGGTTTTITSFVLAVLLKEIQVIGTSVRIPIIVDEISALDAENTASTIQQIGEHGFSIFCATPELTAYLVSEVGRYIYINQNVAKNIMEPECQWNIMPHHVNHWGTHEAQS